MDTLRKPFQGVWNIIRFNWHFYLLSGGLLLVLFAFSFVATPIHPNYSLVPALAVLTVTIVSLLVSSYIYDLSNLYTLQWVDQLLGETPKTVMNINAGFDETSSLFAAKYAAAELVVLDFYDPKKHTEVSIKRARKAYPPHPGTLSISTDSVPLEANSVGVVFALLSVHEIRNDEERVRFFKELRRVLRTSGKIVVTEHLRDVPNFLAYTIGFFHFHSKKTWLRTFDKAGLQLTQELRITPFLTTFVLQDA